MKSMLIPKLFIPLWNCFFTILRNYYKYFQSFIIFDTWIFRCQFIDFFQTTIQFDYWLSIHHFLFVKPHYFHIIILATVCIDIMFLFHQFDKLIEHYFLIIAFDRSIIGSTFQHFLQYAILIQNYHFLLVLYHLIQQI